MSGTRSGGARATARASGPARSDTAVGPDRTRRLLIDTVGGQVQVTRCGLGDDVVVLLHHAPASSACWTELLPELAARGGSSVFAIDLPGYGGSDRPDRPVDGPGPELDWYADRVTEVIAEVIAPAGRPVVLVGRQTGAAVAAAVAVRHPTLVDALVLWGYPDFEEPLRTALATEVTPELGPDLEPLHRFVGELRRHDRSADPGAPAADEYVRRALADHLTAGLAQHWAHNAVGRADLPALAAAVGPPTLVIYDRARSDLAAQQEATRRVLAQLPHGELIDLPGVASSLETGRAAALAEVVVDFAARVRPPTRPDPEPEPLRRVQENDMIERKTAR